MTRLQAASAAFQAAMHAFYREANKHPSDVAKWRAGKYRWPKLDQLQKAKDRAFDRLEKAENAEKKHK